MRVPPGHLTALLESEEAFLREHGAIVETPL